MHCCKITKQICIIVGLCCVARLLCVQKYLSLVHPWYWQVCKLQTVDCSWWDWGLGWLLTHSPRPEGWCQLSYRLCGHKCVYGSSSTTTTATPVVNNLHVMFCKNTHFYWSLRFVNLRSSDWISINLWWEVMDCYMYFMEQYMTVIKIYSKAFNWPWYFKSLFPIVKILLNLLSKSIREPTNSKLSRQIREVSTKTLAVSIEFSIQMGQHKFQPVYSFVHVIIII